MDKTRASPELAQAELLPNQDEQDPADSPRKRQLGDDDDAEPRAKRARTAQATSEPAPLTRKNLARFNKMVNPKESTGRGSSTESPSTKKTKSTTASGFAIQARNNGILDPLGSKPPTNLEEIRERLARSRQTASPPESEYRRYTRTVAKAYNEATMVYKVGGMLLKEYEDDGYGQALNQPFTGYPKDAGFNNGLSAPQPDFVEGLESEEFRPLPVDDYVSGAVLYKDDPRSITLPHIAGEWKARGKDMDEAALQSSYDGAALVYARNQALAYEGKSDPPGHASVTTFTTNGGLLDIYAHYASPGEDDTLEYHQHHVKSTNLVGSHGEYKEGRRALRNAQDHAREQSYALKDDLKMHYKKQRDNLRAIAEGAPMPPNLTDTHDGDSGYEIVEPPADQPCQPTPASSTKHHKSRSHSHPSSKAHSVKSSHSHHGEGSKRKASTSPPSHGSSVSASKHGSYWRKDRSTGRYYHVHSNGDISWQGESEHDE